MFKLTLTQGRRTEALTAKIVILPDKLPINDRFYYNTYIFGSDGHIWVPGREALHVFDRETLSCITSDERFGYDKLTK
jgi:hypothetical protein